MGLGRGIKCFVEGAKLAFSAPLRKFILLPALLSLVIIGGGLGLAFSFVADASSYLAGLGVWPGVIEWVLEPLLYLFGILVGAWLFGFLAVIVGAPFHSVLNAHIHPKDTPSTAEWYQQIAPALKRELSKAKYTLPRLVGLLLLGFVPIVNLATPFLWLGYGGWLMAVQFCDFSFENRDQPFEQTLETLRQYRSTCVGFGMLTTLGLAIPLLNFIVVPIAVAGGALLMRDVAKH
jgi:CysZ protein